MSKPSRPEVIKHILGMNCPDVPGWIMGTNHSFTWWPTETNCGKCGVAWDVAVMNGTAPPLDEEGRIKINARIAEDG